MASRPKSKPTPSAPDANGPVPPAEVLTLAEAAAFLRVPEEGLRQDAAAGRVPGRLIAGQWRFVKEALLDWLSQPEPQPGRAKTGAELVERIRAIRERSQFPETEEEAEAFLAGIYAARKADRVGA